MDRSSVLRRAKQVTFEVVAGEAILIDMNSGTYFSLNEVGTMFWEELDGRRTLEELAGLIADTYNEKSVRFVGRLKRAVRERSDLDLADTAEAFGMEVDEVEEFLARLNSEDPEEAAAGLTAELHVQRDVVVDDLLELAQKMLADELLEKV
jgi:hypothetical protein